MEVAEAHEVKRGDVTDDSWSYGGPRDAIAMKSVCLLSLVRPKNRVRATWGISSWCQERFCAGGIGRGFGLASGLH